MFFNLLSDEVAAGLFSVSNIGNDDVPVLTTISTDSELDYEVMTSLTFDVIATNLCDPEDEVREAEVDEDSRLTVAVQVYCIFSFRDLTIQSSYHILRDYLEFASLLGV